MCIRGYNIVLSIAAYYCEFRKNNLPFPQIKIVITNFLFLTLLTLFLYNRSEYFSET